MSHEHRRTWIYLLTSAGAYVVYLTIVIPRLAATPASQVSYVAPLLASGVGSMVAAMIGRVAVQTARPGDSRVDVRDKDISRFGEHASRWFVIAGAAAGFVMALAKWDYFWIANVIYLGFVLWAVGGSIVKLVAYVRGM